MKYYISYNFSRRGTGFGAIYLNTPVPLDSESAIESAREYLDQQLGRQHILLWWTPVQP